MLGFWKMMQLFLVLCPGNTRMLLAADMTQCLSMCLDHDKIYQLSGMLPMCTSHVIEQCRIQNITNFLRQQNPYTPIILLGLLPRGDEQQNGWFPQPNKFTNSIGEVNAQLSSFATAQNTSRLVYLDCTAALLYPDGQVQSLCYAHLHAPSSFLLHVCMMPLTNLLDTYCMAAQSACNDHFT